jgi:uncharacterized membrane protein YidH (DUF202 family)
MTPAEGAEDTPAEDMEDMDPGLAQERTELAWTRTAISFAALGGAILKITPAAGVLVLAASALVWEIGRLARRSVRPEASDQRHRLLLITIAVTVVSLVALAVALLSGGKSPLTPQ